jgi:hypothetical protein
MPSPSIRAINGRLGLHEPNALTTERSPFVPTIDTEPLRATYGVFIPDVVPAAAPTDLFQIRGSATKTIRVKALWVEGIATAASDITLRLIRRSAANTGGTSTAPVGVARDTTNDTATAFLLLYSVNPTALGAAVGVAGGGRVNLAVANSNVIDRVALVDNYLDTQAHVLRGPTQWLSLNLNGDPWPAGGVLNLHIIWSEE